MQKLRTTIVTDTVEGLIDDTIWYGYNIKANVLYFHPANHKETPSVPEETNDRCFLLHSEANHEAVGLAIVKWWKQFGLRNWSDSRWELGHYIEPWSEKIAA